MPNRPLKSDKPSPQQRAFIELLADPDDFRPVAEKARECGYVKDYAYQLKKDPSFAEWTLVRCRELVRGKLPDIHRLMVRDATSDGAEPIDRHRAAKIVMQVTGEIAPASLTLNDNRTVNIGFPERIAALFAERREMLREVGIVEESPSEAAGGGGKKGNGNGNGNSAGE